MATSSFQDVGDPAGQATISTTAAALRARFCARDYQSADGKTARRLLVNLSKRLETEHPITAASRTRRVKR